MSLSNLFGDENNLWIAILIGILIVCSITHREGFEAPFIPAQPWIEAVQYPAPYRADELYLGGSTKCFSCEKDMIKRGGPVYLAHPTKCVDCDAQAVTSYGDWAGQFGQNNKCFSCESQYAPNPFMLESRNITPKKTPHQPMASYSGAPRATPYCHPAKGCGDQSPRVSRYGRADGQSFDDHISDDGVGLVAGFGRADGLGSNEGDTTNPTGYTL
jgi:hypothetical protein